MSPDPGRTAVYRIFGEADSLLYVGITNDVAIRWNQHQRVQPWWRELRSLTFEWHDSRAEAEDAEKTAIRAERPKYNIAHAVERPESAPKRKKAASKRPATAYRDDGRRLKEITVGDIEKFAFLAALGGWDPRVYRPVPADDSPEAPEWIARYESEFIAGCSKGAQIAIDMLAQAWNAERKFPGYPNVVAASVATRRHLYIKLSCPCCHGSPGSGLTCRECGTEGPDPTSEDLASVELPEAIRSRVNFPQIGNVA